MIRVRFAPSPTGYLHLGNIRTALFNYLFAKRQGGKYILRIEDTDRDRSGLEYEQALMDDLRWMGLEWDEGPDVGGPFGPYRQSERLQIYQACVDQLLAEGKAYECYVTPEEVEEMKHLAKVEKRTLHFDNRGRYFTKEEIERRKCRGIRPTVRFKIEKPLLKIHDLIRGEVAFNLDDMVGDFIIRRADGTPTFHLAVCVDDALMQITHVIRGEDHLSNTPKHILLLEALGYQPPQYGHLSLVHGPGGEPLSKRLDSISVRFFRQKGYLPHAVANYIALLGWSPGDDREVIPWEELKGMFDLARVSKSSSCYDPQKLDWLNGEHLRLLSDKEFSDFAMKYLKSKEKMEDEEMVLKILPAFKDNIERLEQLAERLQFLKEDFSYEEAAWIRNDESRELFGQAISVLDEMQVVGNDFYQNFLDQLKKRVKARGKNLMLPLRLAVTGKVHGPELKRIIPVLVIEFLRKRLRRALHA
ncbi:MAG: glutamate--tRNA ligase [Candidatus Omnitrophica bacterium]|nr:glutamate--tRNA ligase [Candidatus Omnitrophota bacterium]